MEPPFMMSTSDNYQALAPPYRDVEDMQVVACHLAVDPFYYSVCL